MEQSSAVVPCRRSISAAATGYCRWHMPVLRRAERRPERLSRGAIKLMRGEAEAGEALEALARVKRRRGYRDL